MFNPNFILNEMDLDRTSDLVDETVRQIIKDLTSGKIDKDHAVKQTEQLLFEIQTQLSLSDLTFTEKAEFKDIFLFLRVVGSEIKNLKI